MSQADRLDNIPRRTILSITLLVYVALGGLAVALGLLLGEHPWLRVIVTPGSLARALLALLPMLALLTIIMGVPCRPFIRLKNQAITLLGPLFERCRFFDLVLVAALAGFCEELLFRGELQPVAARWIARLDPASAPPAITSDVLAIGAVSLVFACLHAVSATYFAVAFAISFYLGVLYWLWDDLLVPILAHGVYDLLALVWVVRALRGRESAHQHTSLDRSRGEGAP